MLYVFNLIQPAGAIPPLFPAPACEAPAVVMLPTGAKTALTCMFFIIMCRSCVYYHYDLLSEGRLRK